jgi:hypothetical protein
MSWIILIFINKHIQIAWFWICKRNIPIIERFEIDITDKMRTFTEHIALQIAIITRKKGTLFGTGGA